MKEDLCMLNSIRQSNLAKLPISRTPYAANSCRLGERSRQEFYTPSISCWSQLERSYWALMWQCRHTCYACICGQISACTTVEQHHSCWLEVDIYAQPHWSSFPAVLLLETECNFSPPMWVGQPLCLSECLPNEHQNSVYFARLNLMLPVLPHVWYLLEHLRCYVLSVPIALHGNTAVPTYVCFNTSPLWIHFLAPFLY